MWVHASWVSWNVCTHAHMHTHANKHTFPHKMHIHIRTLKSSVVHVSCSNCFVRSFYVGGSNSSNGCCSDKQNDCYSHSHQWGKVRQGCYHCNCTYCMCIYVNHANHPSSAFSLLCHFSLEWSVCHHVCSEVWSCWNCKDPITRIQLQTKQECSQYSLCIALCITTFHLHVIQRNHLDQHTSVESPRFVSFICMWVQHCLYCSLGTLSCILSQKLETLRLLTTLWMNMVWMSMTKML